MRYELQSIGVWTVIKVSFFFNLVAGFVIGLIGAPFLGTLAAMVMSFGAMLEGLEVDPAESSMGSMFIIVPLVSALVWAFVGTLLMAVLTVIYNLVATMLGGLEFDFRDIEAFREETEMEEELAEPERPAPTATAAPPEQPRQETPPPPPPLKSAGIPTPKIEAAPVPPPPPPPKPEQMASVAEPEKVGDSPSEKP